ncbi:MAG TPA: winged helix-turn-helix domain-containing protein [Candidatus Acidoferrum sp.]|nr:winged helix-turn-helix domain-containing protein [Candidatus Acidoferrum sp.]
MEAAPQTRRTRFGAFEVDVRAGEVYKHGIRLKLQDQPFQVLAVLLEHAGDVVTREELRQKLWPADTFVDFDTGLNTAIKKLRDVLADSAEEPRYIETLPRRGYRFIARVENGDLPAPVPIEKRLAMVPPVGPRSEPSKKRRFIVAAGFATFLMVAALVTWRVFFARPVLTGSDVILLASFVNKTGDPIFDNSLDKPLEVKLTESPFLSLLSEADIASTMRMMRRNPDERVTLDLGVEICKRRGLKALVVPEIAAVGSTYVITLDAIDAQNQKLIARQQVEASNKDQVIAALGNAGSRLRKRLGEGLSSLQKFDAPLDLATTSSLEALQAYRSGLTLYRSGKSAEAIPFFERAVELDPQFCSAYAQLGRAQHTIGQSQEERASFARAFELKDRRLTQEENFETTALYYSAITGNLEKEAPVVLLYRQIYPRSVDAANLLGIYYAMMGKTEEALQEFRWVIAHSPAPSAAYYSNASQALIILGRFDDAKKLLDQWRQQGSLTPLQLMLRYRIAFIEHDTATMDRLAGESSGEYKPWVDLQKNLAFLRGDVATVRSLSDALVRRQRKANHMENVAEELAYHADVEAYLGNYHLARRLCAQADEAGNNSALGLFGCSQALAQAADTSAAEALAAKLNELLPEDTFQQKVRLPVTYSTIQRARGNLRAAVDLLSPVTQFPNVAVFYGRARAYMAAGDQVKAVADFQTVIRNPGWTDWGVFEPLSQLGLAQAYAKQGDHEKSRKAYDDFFSTWKDADADIPILRQAKAEYKKLTATASAATSAARGEQ